MLEDAQRAREAKREHRPYKRDPLVDAEVLDWKIAEKGLTVTVSQFV
jgi:hypothetical protein